MSGWRDGAEGAEIEKDVTRRTSRIDQAAARSARLKGETKTLLEELAALAKKQAELDQHAPAVPC